MDAPRTKAEAIAAALGRQAALAYVRGARAGRRQKVATYDHAMGRARALLGEHRSADECRAMGTIPRHVVVPNIRRMIAHLRELMREEAQDCEARGLRRPHSRHKPHLDACRLAYVAERLGYCRFASRDRLLSARAVSMSEVA